MPAMQRHAVSAFFVLMSAIATGQVDRESAPDAGVPLSLAQERATRVSDLRYELHFSIPSTEKTTGDASDVKGRAIVHFTLADTSRPLALDFAPEPDWSLTVHANGTTFTARDHNEHLIVPAEYLRKGTNELSIEFRAGDAPLNRQPEFMYTLFVPARAHLAFPCFDQPDLKARYSLTLDIPSGWQAIANGEEIDRQTSGQQTTVRFAETKPIPTYLFAFAAGRFFVETAERNGRRFRMLHRETDAAKVARNKEAVFDLHASALQWLEKYTQLPYAFGKFDFLLVPSFQFGGMEHPGAIFYNASGILLDPSATQNQKLGRASLIAHETSHMWFGDLVTMRWFDDVWMKEVFANFMAAKIVNPSFPEINHELRFLYAHYPAAYDVDRTPGTNPIRQQLDNLNEAGSLYGAIIYQKAPIVMRQLEMIVTPAGLRDGLRQYLKEHAYGNATWTDLIRLLDRRTPEDLAGWSRAWVEEAGRPTITIDVEDYAGSLSYQQEDPVPERGLLWAQRLKVVRAYPNAAAETLDYRMTAGAGPNRLAANHVHKDRFLYLLPTGGGIGYGDFVLDPASRTYLTTHLADVPDALTRGAALVTLWEEMLDGRVTPETMFYMLGTALPREADELNVARMLSYTQQVFWKFLLPDNRDRHAAALERMLRAGLASAKTSSLKSAWFNALRDVARTPATIQWLERVWKKSEDVPGLTLAEPDYMTLALELAVREVPAWKQILDEQLSRIANPDRKAQFQFVMPALSAETAVREAFFERLRDVKNRRREAWVLQALGYMHHPLRAETAERQIDTSLEMLQEIQRTGDIFFPKRWMDATLNGHQSASAAHRVSQFLERLPKAYPDRLRRIILSSADDLFRARRILER
jgi:aminopeptidase N